LLFSLLASVTSDAEEMVPTVGGELTVFEGVSRLRLTSFPLSLVPVGDLWR
jgi:hypothetical protein